MPFLFVALENPEPQTPYLRKKHETMRYTPMKLRNACGRTQKMVTQLTQFTASDYTLKH